MSSWTNATRWEVWSLTYTGTVRVSVLSLVVGFVVVSGCSLDCCGSIVRHHQRPATIDIPTNPVELVIQSTGFDVART